jgi:YgiT-type zinc finger domain-containing protein
MKCPYCKTEVIHKSTVIRVERDGRSVEVEHFYFECPKCKVVKGLFGEVLSSRTPYRFSTMPDLRAEMDSVDEKWREKYSVRFPG